MNREDVNPLDVVVSMLYLLLYLAYAVCSIIFMATFIYLLLCCIPFILFCSILTGIAIGIVKG